MKIERCRVNHLENPIGYELNNTSFSFQVTESMGKRLKRARLFVFTDEECTNTIADTGMSENIDPLGTELLLSLRPRTAYYWKVTAESDVGEVAEGAVCRFETGKMDEAWIGKWLTCEEKGRTPIFSKAFKVRKNLVSARLYICGLGLYEPTINGKKVGDEYLLPYCTSYSDYVQAHTFDVTKNLSEGENIISAELSDGWYKGRFGFESRDGDGGFYGDCYSLIAELHLVYGDGGMEKALTEEIIATDESWDLSYGNITFANIYDGEHRDDTLEELKGSVLLLPEEKVKKLHINDRLSIPVVAHEEISPVELIHTPAGEWVYDLGQNFAGIFRLKVNEPKGTKIHVQVGEVMQKGNFYRDNLRTAKAEYFYTSNGKEAVIEPKFTFYGYRYVKVSGVDSPKIEDLTGIALYSDIKPVGELTTGDSKLNQLISNIRWGQKSNFIDVPTDCPQRDERMGWTADTQVFVPTASYFTDAYAFYRKYLKDIRTDQAHLKGAVPFVVPSFGQKNSCSVWGDAATIIPWTLYLYYGDKQILRESLQSMADWVDYIGSVDGDNHGWRKIFHFGDWLALDHPKRSADQVMGGTETGYIADIYYMQSAELTAKAADVLGEKDLQKKYEKIADEVRQGILDEYFSKTGRTIAATETGYTLALLHKLTINRERTLTDLVNLLGYGDNKLSTGFVGTPLILKVLSDEGYYKLCYEVLHNEEYPGWLYEVNLGATTIWERWNSLGEDGTISSTGMNSFNHYAYGSVGEWMWQNVAGIRPVENEPGFRKAIIRPIPDYKMKKASAVYNSVSGTYKVSWEVRDVNHITLQVTVPFNCEAKLLTPYEKGEKERELSAGEYSFEIETEKPLKLFYSVDSPLKDILENKDAKDVLTKILPDYHAPEWKQENSIRELLEELGDGLKLGRLGDLDKALKAL